MVCAMTLAKTLYAACLIQQQAHPALPAMFYALLAVMHRAHGSVVALRVWALLLVPWCAALWQRLEPLL